jgi:hypothetical protein
VALPEGSAKDDREGHPLQNAKGQRLCWSWRNWLEDQLGLAEKSVEEFWAVLQSLGPGLREGDELVDAGGGAVAQAALDLGSR